MSEVPPVIVYNKESDVLLTQLTGEQSVKSVMTAYDEIREHADYRPGMKRIWDMRDASFEKCRQPADFEAMTEYSNRFEGVPSDGQVAVVVSGKMAYGMTRMFALATQGRRSVEIHVCESIEEAYEMLESCPRAR